MSVRSSPAGLKGARAATAPSALESAHIGHSHIQYLPSVTEPRCSGSVSPFRVVLAHRIPLPSTFAPRAPPDKEGSRDVSAREWILHKYHIFHANINLKRAQSLRDTSRGAIINEPLHILDCVLNGPPAYLNVIPLLRSVVCPCGIRVR